LQGVITIRRLCAASALVAIILGTLLASPAGATPPTRETSSDTFDVDFGDEVCGFPLLAHIQQTVTQTTFFDRDGNQTGGIITGRIFVTFSSGDATVQLAIPGPTFLDADGNAVRGTGTWATFTSDGSFVWAAGNIVFDESGNASQITGVEVSLCDLF
jgi:hypothetical protein